MELIRIDLVIFKRIYGIGFSTYYETDDKKQVYKIDQQIGLRNEMIHLLHNGSNHYDLLNVSKNNDESISQGRNSIIDTPLNMWGRVMSRIDKKITWKCQENFKSRPHNKKMKTKTEILTFHIDEPPNTRIDNSYNDICEIMNQKILKETNNFNKIEY